jgi:hypothetical protein
MLASFGGLGDSDCEAINWLHREADQAGNGSKSNMLCLLTVWGTFFSIVMPITDVIAARGKSF